MEEIWKSIEHYEDAYEISNHGHVRRTDGVELSIQGPPSRRYCAIQLWKNGVFVTRAIHRLVALAFIPNPEDKPEVNHKDGVKSNNCADNLEWMTRSEQMKHAFATGLHSVTGERNPAAILQEKDIPIICEMYESGDYTQTAIAERFGVSKDEIYRIVTNQHWKHIKRNVIIPKKKAQRKGRKLSTEQAKSIKLLLIWGMNYKIIAKLFSISSTYVLNIRDERKLAHVKLEI